MKQAILSFLLVLVCGYLGCFLNLAGCIVTTVAAATACIVYSIKNHHKIPKGPLCVFTRRTNCFRSTAKMPRPLSSMAANI